MSEHKTYPIPDERFTGVIAPAPEVAAIPLEDDGAVPNNPKLPLLLYRGVLHLPRTSPAKVIEELFHLNQWGSSWRNGVFDYQHYHSTAHEVLGVANGEARILFGGKSGKVVTVKPGDVAILPAGTGHENLGDRDRFTVVGAYPPGQQLDMGYGRPGERPRSVENIARVPLPPTDPVYGNDGPIWDHWGLR